MSDPLFRRTWQSALIASCFSLAACGGGGDSASGSGGLYQSITFEYPGGAMLASGTYTLNATADSGLPVTFRSGTPNTCTVSGNQLTVLKADECLIIASQSGGTGPDGRVWAPADDAGQLFRVLKHPQVVTFTPPDYVLSANTSSIPLSATADTGLPVTFSSTTPDVCSINGSTLQVKAKGSCAIVATQAGDPTYSAQSVQRFVAVDPLILADGFTPGTGGRGSSNSMSTKQGGAVTANPWGSPLNAGWEWCDANAGGDWCYRTVSDDGSSMTSALDIPDSKYTPGGWQYSFNRIDIFAPGLSGFNQSGDTTTGLQVTTEKSLVFTLGMNKTLFSAGKPVVVHLDLGKRNNGCNVQLSAHLWPAAAGLVSYSIPLGDFAVTNSCGLAGVTQASLDDDVRKVPSPWPTDTNPNAPAQYQAALDKFKAARTSATDLLKTSTIVRTRFWLMEVNTSGKPLSTDIPAPTAADMKLFSSRLTIKGAITIQ